MKAKRIKFYGVYKIFNIINKKIYFGSSKDVFKRLKEHRRLLRKNEHPNLHL